VMASGAFGLCVPGTVLAHLTHAVGSTSGRDGDKFAQQGIAASRGRCSACRSSSAAARPGWNAA
jgi:hypothetical protein